jgi:hypothetical protein
VGKWKKKRKTKYAKCVLLNFWVYVILKMSEFDGNTDKRPRDEAEDYSQMTESQDSLNSQIEESQARKRARASELPELNNALVVFANEMATVNDEIEQAPSGEAQMVAPDEGASDGEESVTSSIRSGASASTYNTIDSNASNASTEIEAFFAPQLPEVNIDFERVSDLFTGLANAFTTAATKVSSSVAPIAMSAATQALTLPEPVRNQLSELSMAVSMLGVSRYLPNINMAIPGVNTLLSSISGVSQLLSGYGVTASIVGIGLITSIRTDLPANIIARIFSELTITEAGLNNVSFAAQESTDKAKLARATYKMLRQDYEVAMEALINAIQNKQSVEEIARLEGEMNIAKNKVMSAIGDAKAGAGSMKPSGNSGSAGGPGAGVGYGGKRQSQKKQQKQQQKKQKQQKKTQKQSHKKLSKSKRAKKAKQSKKANKKH